MRTLYVSDMDGTLLGSDSRVSEKSAELLDRLIAGGVLFTVATARTAATVRPLLKGISMNIPAIVMTGAAYWDFTAGRYTDVRYFPRHDLMTAIETCREAGIHPFVYIMSADESSLDVYHSATEMNKAERNFYEERARLKRFHLATPLPSSAMSSAVLVYAMGPGESIGRAAEIVRARTECAVSCYPDIFNHANSNLEIFASGVSKASAVRRLCDRTGADRLVVFGDNLNDLPMLAEADVAVAVGNAFPEVKEAADIVIGPNYTDAVPRFISTDQQ